MQREGANWGTCAQGKKKQCGASHVAVPWCVDLVSVGPGGHASRCCYYGPVEWVGVWAKFEL